MDTLRARSPTRLAAMHEDGSSRPAAADAERPGRESLELEAAPLILRPGSGGSGGSGGGGGGQHDHSHERIDWLTTSLLFLCPAVAGGLFGYDIGASSGALLSITSPEHSGTDWYQLSAVQQGLVVSLSLAGALASSSAALVFGDRWGRRRELIAASVLYAAASALAAVAPGLPALLASRATYGAGIGLAMHAAPAYLAETAPARVRGLLISLKEAFIVLGILLGYLASYAFVDAEGGWRWMYGLAGTAAAALFAGMLWAPESPRWLLLSGKGPRAATEALRRTKGRAADEAEIHREIEEIEATIATSPTAKAGGGALGGFSELFRERNRRPLAIGVGLMLAQQITGQPSVLYYAASIFQSAGFASASEATKVSLWLGMFKLAMTGVAVAKVDSWGRRPLLLGGVSALVVSLLVLAAAAGDGGRLLPDGALAWANLVALLTYVGAYQLSFGPVSWLICGEVFPLKVRSQAIALATITNFAANFLVSLLLPSFRETAGPAATYFTFAAIGVLAVGGIWWGVPETKGKTLEEIEAMWSDGSSGAARPRASDD